MRTSFTITNDGNDTLLLRKVKPSCGCTITSPKKDILIPDESTTIEVSYNTGNYPGNQKKLIRVIANDPKNPSTKLWIKAIVKE